MTTSGACGDITRNVVGCTVAGLAHDEIVDGYATAEAIHEYFLDNKLYSNLPRKYKVSVTGCAEDCARGLINDIALSAAIHDGRHARLQPARRRRALHAAALRPLGRHLRHARGGARGRRRGHRHLPRLRGEPEGARQGAPEVPRRPHRARGAARGDRARASAATLRRGVPKAPGLCGEDHIGVLPQADGAHRTVGLVVPVGRLKAAPAVRARRASPASTATTRTTRCASPTSRTSCCRGSRARTSTRCWPSR